MIRRLARSAAVAAPLFAILAGPATVAGHVIDATYVSRLPLVAYLVGAGLAVALSFAFVLISDLRAEPPATIGRTFVAPRPVTLGLRVIGLVGWLWIVVQGILGGTSTADVGTLFVWVYTWVGVAIVSALIGPIWHWLDPFATLHDLGAWVLRRLGIRGWEPADYPAALDKWPAVAGFAFVVWVELILKGGIGRTLFVVVVGYTAVTLAMMGQFGRDTWRSKGEVFGVWFRLLNRLAPFSLVDEAGRLRRRPFAGGLLEPGWSTTDLVLIAFAVGSILFDGLSQTTPWYEVLGAPPVPIQTLQLAGFLGLVALAALGASRFVGVASAAAGLLPIAFGYLVAHYLTYLLIDGQRILVALSDPLQRGWEGPWAFNEPVTWFLPPGIVWTIQLVSVVGGHMVGAWAGHVVAARSAPRDVRVRQVPLAAVMVGLTTLTLWSLGQAVVVTPDEAPQSGSASVVSAD